jgi:prolyl-tRNA synthetase
LGAWTYLTFASGGAFAEFSHEFQTLTDAGEDTIFLHRGKKIAINEEVMNEKVLDQLGMKLHELEEVRAAEVGNIFNLGTSKSEALGLQFTDEAGRTNPVVMGSYGIGPARVMGVIVERYADEKGMVWPEAVAPFAVHLVRLGDDAAVVKAADKLYGELEAVGMEVLYDDRDESAGAKFADADLMGVPLRVTVSKKTLEHGSAEFKRRGKEAVRLVKLGEVARELN